MPEPVLGPGGRSRSRYLTVRAGHVRMPRMTGYLLLPRASGGRVYGRASAGLAAAEVSWLARAWFSVLPDRVEPVEVAGTTYLAVERDPSLDSSELDVLANSSIGQVLFERVGDLLRPIQLQARQVADEDVVSIQRYQGKTNEAFTHLLVNVTLAASPGALRRWLAGERVRLLDPLCGRGTTLNRCVLAGMDAYGIDRSRPDVEAYDRFIVRWLKDKRIKHRATRETLRRGRQRTARRFRLTYGPTGAEHIIEVANDETAAAADHFPARSMDLIVVDLPYGVQHAARSAGGKRRRPADLLAESLPVWVTLLRSAGAMGLAFNRRTLPRPELVEVIRSAGLHVVPPVRSDDEFVHDVDRSITRDVLVARPARWEGEAASPG